MNFAKLTLAAAAMLSIAAPLSAQEEGGGSLEFNLGNETFVMDVPAGYCEPTGLQALVAKQISEGDTANLTAGHIQRCGTQGEDYALIKSPRGFPSLPIPKASFIDLMAAELKKGESLKKGFDQGREDIKETTGGTMDVEVNAVNYDGKDEECVYLIGSLQVVVEGGRTKDVMVGSCGTLIGTRHMFFHSYVLEGGDTTFEQLKARSRSLALGTRKK